MSRELLVLILAAVCYLGAFGYAVVSLRHGTYQPGRWTLLILGIAALFQTVFLSWRGQAIGGCPMTTPFELLTFISWSIVVLYFIIGPAYRLSLLGVFTAPLALLFQISALLRPEALAPPVPRLTHSFWGELHAALALVSYGAFALASAAGLMFLLQDRQLKQHRISPVLRQLPPIHYLTRAIRGLLLTGTGLLTIAIVSAYRMEKLPPSSKLTIVWIVWALYASLIAYEYSRGMSARRAAATAAFGFLIPVISLWFIGRH
ncbi:MAG: cytochrome c assembly protein [Verrucomicrobiales bacterium]|nr:cytochrome c assembly protein [Verrucomicrobiales bacterium]